MQPPGLLAPNLDMTYHDVGQTQRRRAGGTNFHDDFLGVAVIQEGLLFNTFVTRDNRGNLVGLRTGSGYYYLFDGLGSVVALTDAAGKVVNRYAYDPYGNRLASGTSESVANPFQFTGGYRDTTGFYKFGTRYYDASVGRWTQRDPSGIDGNAYAYAANDPVNFVDPSGGKGEDVSAGEYVGGCLVNAAIDAALTAAGGATAAAAGIAAAGGCALDVAANVAKERGWISDETADSISLTGIGVKFAKALFKG